MLGTTHFYEILVEGFHLLGSYEEVLKFQFVYGEHNEFYDLVESEEWAIVGWYGYVLGEKCVGPCLADGLAFIK